MVRSEEELKEKLEELEGQLPRLTRRLARNPTDRTSQLDALEAEVMIRLLRWVLGGEWKP